MRNVLLFTLCICLKCSLDPDVWGHVSIQTNISTILKWKILQAITAQISCFFCPFHSWHFKELFSYLESPACWSFSSLLALGDDSPLDCPSITFHMKMAGCWATAIAEMGKRWWNKHSLNILQRKKGDSKGSAITIVFPVYFYWLFNTHTL